MLLSFLVNCFVLNINCMVFVSLICSISLCEFKYALANTFIRYTKGRQFQKISRLTFAKASRITPVLPITVTSL